MITRPTRATVRTFGAEILFLGSPMSTMLTGILYPVSRYDKIGIGAADNKFAHKSSGWGLVGISRWAILRPFHQYLIRQTLFGI
jgi:hypothetical protein